MRWTVWLAGSLWWIGGLWAMGQKLDGLRAELLVRQQWDGNLFQMDEGTLGGRTSWVTVVVPHLSLKTSWGFLEYLLERAWYHDEPVESFSRHHFKGNLNGKAAEWSWGHRFTGAWTDGSREPLVFDAPGGSPALGAPEVRQRRENFVAHFESWVRYDGNPWFVRGEAYGRFWDFMVIERTAPGTQNYYDRMDFRAGVDVGWDWGELGETYVGWRHGFQRQDPRRAFRDPKRYNNLYHRALIGWEGKSAKWQWSLQGGLDMREFTEEVAPGFERERAEWFTRAEIKWRPFATTEWTAMAIRSSLPSSGGAGMFVDTVLLTKWRQRLWPDPQWDQGRGWLWQSEFKVWENDFNPAKRRDRRYSTCQALEWDPDAHWHLRVDYQYEWSDSDESNTPAREYQRHSVGFEVSWHF